MTGTSLSPAPDAQACPEPAVRVASRWASGPYPSHSTLRWVLGHFATGVSIVTGMFEDCPVGMVANSFTSVSLEPPLVLFCAQPRSTTLRSVRRSGAFAVNILGEDGQELSRRFACRSTERFAAVPYRRGRTGAPLLRCALAWVECLLEAQHSAGDHVIVVGRVVNLGAAGAACDPLIFFRAGYHHLGGALPRMRPLPDVGDIVERGSHAPCP